MLKQLLARKTDFNEPDDTHGPTLRRTLGPWGLTALGIGAVIGGGVLALGLVQRGGLAVGVEQRPSFDLGERPRRWHRSEERRVGQACVRSFRTRWAPFP